MELKKQITYGSFILMKIHVVRNEITMQINPRKMRSSLLNLGMVVD
jgi:hypothetical protein